ncbi:MAG TPA: 4-amino-4-deoxychorismate lyase, partial [Acidimicrobiia bacterium]|nr:4-amino-4-deoxychorismate lyase [Acidimicrobiia bacterium]
MVEAGSSVALGACWVDGRLVEPGTATVRADDHAVVVGDGVFETMKIVDGAAFALSRHLRRLDRSASGLGLDEPDEDLIRTAIHEVLAADPSAGLLRITWSSGAGPWGSGRGDGPGTLVVGTGPGNVWPAAERVHLVQWRRNEHGPLVGLKTTSYAENVLALTTAKRIGCSEALFANTAGHLCEGTGTNVFLVVEGVLVTPPLSSGCLAGVTRELVMELADVVERDIDPAEFGSA